MVHVSLRVKMLEAFRFRMYVLIPIVAIFFLGLIIQVVNLQLVHGEVYKLKSKANMENFIPIPATRGEIYDRRFDPEKGGINIVTNRPSFNVTTIPARFDSADHMNNVMNRLFSIVNVDSSMVSLELNGKNRWKRIVILEDVGLDFIIKIASNQHLLPNIDWEDAPVRVYKYGRAFSHVVGYIGSISRKEYKILKKKGYKYYQKLGKNGIEKQYDSILRGKDGFVRRIVDVKNRTEGEEVGLKPIAGNNLILTLDYEVQMAAIEAMKDLNGAVVVLKASTGEILSFISKPDFDPNQIISKNNRTLVNELINDKSRPFLNRGIQAKYPPASTFKIITSIAALETEKSHPGKQFFCSGKYTLKGLRDRDFYCFKPHGRLDLYNAISKSCSVYFYQLGYMIGPTEILKYAGYMGLGEKTGIDLPGEESGFIPSKKWKYKTFGQSWYDGDTLNHSIGQGFLLVTPLGLANMVATIVNNGIAYKPKIIKEIRSTDNRKVLRRFVRERLRETPLSPKTLETIKKAMRLGVTEGTQIYLNSLKVMVAGKTGTAQTKSNRKENISQHAWYVGYAPFDKEPEQAVVIAVMVEFGKWGALKAVPVARKVLARMDELGYFK